MLIAGEPGDFRAGKDDRVLRGDLPLELRGWQTAASIPGNFGFVELLLVVVDLAVFAEVFDHQPVADAIECCRGGFSGVPLQPAELAFEAAGPGFVLVVTFAKHHQFFLRFQQALCGGIHGA